MKEMVASVKKPAVLAVLSAASCAAIVLAWLKFPSLIPLPVLVLLGTITAVAAIVAEVIVLLRVLRTAGHHRQLTGEINHLPKRAVIAFILLFVPGNAVLLFLWRLSALDLLAANLAFIFSWFIAWSLAARIRRGTGQKG